MLCKIFNSEMCLYFDCKYYDAKSNDCTYTGQRHKLKRGDRLKDYDGHKAKNTTVHHSSR